MKRSVRAKNYVITLIFIVFFFVFLKPIVVRQIIIRGDGYLGFDMCNDAIRQYSKALLLEPGNIEAVNWLAYAYKRGGRPEKAVRIYEDSLRLAPDNMIAYYELGMTRAVKKDFEEAKAFFLKASSISKKDAMISGADYDFYHESASRMLALCRDRLGEK